VAGVPIGSISIRPAGAAPQGVEVRLSAFD
jgi:hypothetical protein